MNPTVDINEHTEKIEKAEKLPFSIENLLANKVEVSSESTSLGASEVFNEFDDGASDCSEQVDVDGSTVDAQEYMEVKNDYQQPGKFTT